MLPNSNWCLRAVLYCKNLAPKQKPMIMKKLMLIITISISFLSLNAQVAINTTGFNPNSSAMLDVSSDTAGILIPRMSATQRDAIANPAKGLLVYVLDDSTFYYYNSLQWIKLLNAHNSDDDWTVSGNYVYNLGDSVGIGTSSPRAALDVAGRISITNTGHSVFIGEEAGLNDDTTHNDNVFIGYWSGKSSTDANFNTAIGYRSFEKNETGSSNVAVGSMALANNTTGIWNVAIGASSLSINTVGSSNTAVGKKSLFVNRTGFGNTAIGKSALLNNDNGNYNVGVGYGVLYYNHGHYNTATGSFALMNIYEESYNTANGYKALYNDTLGSYNTAMGAEALYSDSTGEYNTALGYHSLYSNTTGNRNIAIGHAALYSNQINSGLVAVGDSALYNAGVSSAIAEANTAVGARSLLSVTNGDYNTAIGYQSSYSNATGDKNTTIGYQAGYSNTGNRNIFIGYKAGYNASGNDRLYISNSDASVPLIYGNFSSGRIGFGTTSPDAKLDVRSTTGNDALRVRVGTTTRLRVHANGSVSVGTSSEGPVNGLESLGNIEPNSHKGADLGASGKAWDDVYCDDLRLEGVSAFAGRVLVEEILNHPPKEKLPGSFDYKTKRGDVELDPASLPPGLAEENSLLTDEISSYNYKTNYEQQVIINKQKEKIESLEKENREIKNLLMQLKERISGLENK